MEIITGVAAGVALILSVWSFTAERRRNRQASLSARLEMYRPPQLQGAADLSFERIVVVNHGPADADEVTIDGVDGGLVIDGENSLAVQRLHAGQEHHLRLVLSMADPFPSHVKLAWKDRRRGRQQRTVHLSVQRLY